MKARLQSGGLVRGVMVSEFATPGLGAIHAASGADFAIFDMEHTGWNLETIKMLVATSRAFSVAPIVRVPCTDYHYIAHAMDVGASGVVIPNVESLEQAKQAIDFAKYPPLGRRGCGFNLLHDGYTGGDFVEKMRVANESGLVIVQIESPKGVANVNEIARVKGIDAFWVGLYDLTTSMGLPGQFDHPDVLEAVASVKQAAQMNGLACVLGSGDPRQLAMGPLNGYQILIYTFDVLIYQAALRECFKTIDQGNQAVID